MCILWGVESFKIFKPTVRASLYPDHRHDDEPNESEVVSGYGFTKEY